MVEERIKSEELRVEICEIYKERNERETPMYLDILPYIRELADQ
ncbi:MAG: hypothetical protein NTZ83_03410 [Candidatus Pacearchaeota archaeon]|nr:hypothetical protein [Candidatus Pacearchaeota archaeon]